MFVPKNERITEGLTRERLRLLKYYDPENDIKVEEQKSGIVEITRLLKTAGKAKKGGSGYPEFIISSASYPDLLIIIECKPTLRQHESPLRDRPVDFAVDGVLHYAKHLVLSFHVVAIAVSGQTDSELKISTFLWPKKSSTYKELTSKSGKMVDDLLPFGDYAELSTYDPEVEKTRTKDLMDFSRDLHDFMRDYAKLTEGEKPLLVSGTLIALRDSAFRKNYDDYSPKVLQQEWFTAIKREINEAEIPNAKKDNMAQPYSSISVHPELGSATPQFHKGILHELIVRIHKKVWPFISEHRDFDVVGQFYGEFLKYTGGDKKSLGIVLTPRHITELFSLLVGLYVRVEGDIIKATKVVDICAGTGGFLISAMQHMLRRATTEAERNYIKKECLIGVEQQPNMYALAASNMILRGDGKANLYQGSCFDEAISTFVKNHKCTVGMINPPYSQKGEGLSELAFVKKMLDSLEEGGTGIAIVPMSSAISPSNEKEELLKHHTLEAVMSMPDELFYPVGVITAIMVFIAKVPHETSNRKTWFGYWKDDGFVKTKHLGRIDRDGRWPAIRDRWVEQFRNREVHPGESVTQYVTANDEWCAEAYMETDYSKITQADFGESVKKYSMFRLLGKVSGGGDDDETR